MSIRLTEHVRRQDGNRLIKLLWEESTGKRLRYKDNLKEDLRTIIIENESELMRVRNE